MTQNARRDASSLVGWNHHRIDLVLAAGLGVSAKDTARSVKTLDRTLPWACLSLTDNFAAVTGSCPGRCLRPQLRHYPLADTNLRCQDPSHHLAALSTGRANANLRYQPTLPRSSSGSRGALDWRKCLDTKRMQLSSPLSRARAVLIGGKLSEEAVRVRHWHSSSISKSAATNLMMPGISCRHSCRCQPAGEDPQMIGTQFTLEVESCHGCQWHCRTPAESRMIIWNLGSCYIACTGAI